MQSLSVYSFYSLLLVASWCSASEVDRILEHLRTNTKPIALADISVGSMEMKSGLLSGTQNIMLVGEVDTSAKDIARYTTFNITFLDLEASYTFVSHTLAPGGSWKAKNIKNNVRLEVITSVAQSKYFALLHINIGNIGPSTSGFDRIFCNVVRFSKQWANLMAQVNLQLELKLEKIIRNAIAEGSTKYVL